MVNCKAPLLLVIYLLRYGVLTKNRSYNV